jgi:hypothetical protein
VTLVKGRPLRREATAMICLLVRFAGFSSGRTTLFQRHVLKAKSCDLEHSMRIDLLVVFSPKLEGGFHGIRYQLKQVPESSSQEFRGKSFLPNHGSRL